MLVFVLCIPASAPLNTGMCIPVSTLVNSAVSTPVNTPVIALLHVSL